MSRDLRWSAPGEAASNPPASEGERGMALVLVLVVVGLLVTLVLQFNYSSRVELELARSYVESVQAAYLAEAGVQVAMALLRTDDNEFDSLDDQWALAIPVIPTDEGFVVLRIEDCARRIDINRMVAGTRNTPSEDLQSIVEHLLVQLGREDARALVDSLVDWLDTDDQITGNGAEEEYYQSLDPPVTIANGPMMSLEELRLVKGFDDELLLGYEEVPGLFNFVTVFGDGKVNINTADSEAGEYPWILTSLGAADLTGQVSIDESLANEIREARSEEPFESSTQLRTRGILDRDELNPLQARLTTKASYFTIRATGAVGSSEAIGSGEMTQKSSTVVVQRAGEGRLRILYWREE